MAFQKQCSECNEWFEPRESFHKTCDNCHGKKGRGSGQQTRREQRPFTPGTPPPSVVSQLPEGYLAKGYLDNGNIMAELVTTIPEEIAKAFGVGGVTSTQLRRFFNKAKLVEQRLETETKRGVGVEEAFNSVIAEILELKQHAANSAGKAQNEKEKKGLELLKQFIDLSVDEAVKSEAAFRKGFLLHFQGVVAYFKYHNPKK